MLAVGFIFRPLLLCHSLCTFTSLPHLPLSSVSSKPALFQPIFGSSARGTSSMELPSQVSEQVEKECFKFGPYKINSNMVFFTTEYSYAFVNLRPVVPGHILVSPKRVVPRFVELTDEEATDMWLTANRIGAKLESHFNATSLTFAMQEWLI
eukprot:c22210_g1_i1 orf=128-583(+)